MTEKSEIEQQREADRRLALLALVSEQPEPCGACLEPEELSALIEGRLTPEQIEPCLTHLAGCERCYALWLRLDREWRGQTGRSNRNTLRRLISRPRVLAAAGSLLAAAASIAVFLNITVDHGALPHLPEKAAQEQALSMPALKTTAQVAPNRRPQPRRRRAAFYRQTSRWGIWRSIRRINRQTGKPLPPGMTTPSTDPAAPLPKPWTKNWNKG